MSLCQTLFCVCACVEGNGDFTWATVDVRCLFSCSSLCVLTLGPSLEPVWGCSCAPLSLASYLCSGHRTQAFTLVWQTLSGRVVSPASIFIFSPGHSPPSECQPGKGGDFHVIQDCVSEPRAQPSTSRCFKKKKKNLSA